MSFLSISVYLCVSLSPLPLPPPSPLPLPSGGGGGGDGGATAMRRPAPPSARCPRVMAGAIMRPYRTCALARRGREGGGGRRGACFKSAAAIIHMIACIIYNHILYTQYILSSASTTGGDGASQTAGAGRPGFAPASARSVEAASRPRHYHIPCVHTHHTHAYPWTHARNAI